MSKDEKYSEIYNSLPPPPPMVNGLPVFSGVYSLKKENMFGEALKGGLLVGGLVGGLNLLTRGKVDWSTTVGAIVGSGAVSAYSAYSHNNQIPKRIYGEVPPLGIHSSLKPPAF